MVDVPTGHHCRHDLRGLTVFGCQDNFVRCREGFGDKYHARQQQSAATDGSERYHSNFPSTVKGAGQEQPGPQGHDKSRDTITSGWKVILHESERTRNPIVDQSSGLEQDRLADCDAIILTRQGDFGTICQDCERPKHLFG